MTTPTLLTTEQAAERLHCSIWHVKRELNSGRLRGSKPAKRWLISESAISEYLERYSNTPQPDKPQRRRRRRW